MRDMDFDMIQEVRNTWHFYFNRRPELYGDIVKQTVSIEQPVAMAIPEPEH